ncbi:MAG: FAD-dependent oxidoreductase, partial [Ignisphaera sp.]
MKAYDVLIVGGGPAGYTTALMLKRLSPGMSVAVIRREERVLIPCAIPYLFNSIDSIDKNILSDESLRKLGVEIFVDEVASVDLNGRSVKTLKSGELGFKKLVLATGSRPKRLGVYGEDLKNVYHIIKDYNYLREMIKAVKEASNIVIVGGGFVGVEIADDLSKTGKNVTLVEVLPHCLLKNFDEDFAILAEEELKKRGVNIKTGVTVSKILGSGRAEKVRLSNGEEIPADVVIIAIGVEPNTDLAKAMNLRIGVTGGIVVDSCRRSSNPIVYAVGDCVERLDLVTGKPMLVQLASAATTDARVAALHMATNTSCRYIGHVGAFSTRIGEVVLGAVGITESRAREEGIEYVVGVAEAVDKHPTILPGAKTVKLKLLV